MNGLHSSRRRFLQSTLTAAGAAASPAILVRHASAAPAGVGRFTPENDKIKHAREAALAVLKPSAKDLEHGLRLHAESLVFESYGFAPRFAVDGEEFARVAAAGASESELADLREEMSMTRGAVSEVERREFLEAFRSAGVTCIFQNAGEEGNNPLRLIKRLARFTHLTDMMRTDLFKAVKPDDVIAAKKDDRLCLYLTGNGVPLRQLWESTRDEMRLIRIFFDLGIRMMHLTYNRRNPMGDGAGEANDGGVSDFGKEVIAEMNRIGVIVDVAHSGWRTSLEAAKASAKPMVASHTTCAELHKHIRAKPDEVIKAICDTGGLIGICCIGNFLGGTHDIAAMMDHIAYAVKKFGAEHVAIGTDVAYVSRNEDAERKKVTSRPGKSPLSASGPKWEHLWPPGSNATTPDGFESLSWTNWPLFTVGMVQRGISDADIRKILGENVMRVTRANFNG